MVGVGDGGFFWSVVSFFFFGEVWWIEGEGEGDGEVGTMDSIEG